MKTITLAIALASMIGLAQAATHEHGMQHEVGKNQSHTTKHQGLGVVKAIRSGKIQIAHEPITSLKWPAMTMWFEMKDTVGQGIQGGDTVHFELMQGEKYKWIIEKIEKH